MKVEAARAAILEMQNALSTASKKMTKVKTTDPKHAPTTKLIADWEKAATAYHRQLEQDVETATRNKALEMVDKVINDAVRNDIEVKFPDFIKAAENALSKRPPNSPSPKMRSTRCGQATRAAAAAFSNVRPF